MGTLACESTVPPSRPLTLPVPQADASVDRPAAPVAGAEGRETKSRLQAYFESRMGLDRTLWAQEAEAQRHERFFVQLWDELRAGRDPVDRLSQAIPTLVLPALGAPEPIVPGVTRRRGEGATTTFDQAGWRAWLTARAAEGLRLSQSEWHHRAFSVDAAGAHSVIKAELHGTMGEGRWLVRCALHVDWAPGADATPTRVEVRDLEVSTRAGPPLLASVQRLDLGDNKPTPLIATDLGDDGVIDLLAPRINARYRWKSGAFVEEALLAHPKGTISAATVADLTGDGHDDLLVAADPEKVLQVLLYAGAPDGSFPTPPQVLFAPEVPLRRVRVMAVGDIEGDGDLDVWVTQYRGAYSEGRMPAPFHDANDGWPSYLLRNDGARFTDVTEAAGLAPLRDRHTQSASFFDLDGDGDADLLTVNDFAGVDVYRNEGGRFVQAPEWVDNKTLFGMSHLLADLDGDMQLDLFATGMNSTTVRRLNAMGLERPDVKEDRRWRTEMTFGNRLYRGAGAGRFTMAPSAGSIAASGWSWGTAAADFDRDGDRDVVVANGFISGGTATDYCTEYWRHDVYLDNSLPKATGEEVIDALIARVESGISWNGFEHNRLFLNRGGGAFVELGWLFGLGQEQDSRNVIATDVDGDGAVDLIVAEIERGRLYANVLRNRGEAGHWLGVRLRGAPGVSPLGARVTLLSIDGEQVAAIVAGDSFMSQHPAVAHFGLGASTAVHKVVVRWPGGAETVIERPAVDRYHVVSPAPSR